MDHNVVFFLFFADFCCLLCTRRKCCVWSKHNCQTRSVRIGIWWRRRIQSVFEFRTQSSSRFASSVFVFFSGCVCKASVGKKITKWCRIVGTLTSGYPFSKHPPRRRFVALFLHHQDGIVKFKFKLKDDTN